MEIAVLAPADTDAAIRLWTSCGLTRPWNDPHADIALARRSPSAAVLAGRSGGRLVATAMTGFDGHRAWVYYLAVSPSCRGRGYGRAMMNAAEHWARARGAPKLELMVRTGNTAAEAFYRAIGYEAAEVTVMARWLDGRRSLPPGGQS